MMDYYDLLQVIASDIEEITFSIIRKEVIVEVAMCHYDSNSQHKFIYLMNNDEYVQQIESCEYH